MQKAKEDMLSSEDMLFKAMKELLKLKNFEKYFALKSVIFNICVKFSTRECYLLVHGE